VSLLDTSPSSIAHVESEVRDEMLHMCTKVIHTSRIARKKWKAGCTMKKLKERTITVNIRSIDTPPENVQLYGPIDDDSPMVIAKAERIKKFGMLEMPVISKDRWIMSGNIRVRAAIVAGLDTIPVRELDIVRGDGERCSDKFLQYLILFNDQRIKGRDVIFREKVGVKDKPHAYERFIAQRKRRSKTNIAPMEIWEGTPPRPITETRRPFLEAARAVIHKVQEEGEASMPIRHIHYQLAFSADPPLMNAKKPDSRYRNTDKCSIALSRLLTDGRYADEIEWEAIADYTREATLWRVYANVGDYLDEFKETALLDYRRDLMKTQPNHIEIVYEKETLRNLVQDVAAEYGIPCTPSRGQNSTSIVGEIAERFRKSGKTKLILITLTDMDADGCVIPNSVAYRLRDLLEIPVEWHHAGITMEQVERYGFPVGFEVAKKTSPSYKRYVETYYADDPSYERYMDENLPDAPPVWELDAVTPLSLLAEMLREKIEAVLDHKAFNAEKMEANKDATFLEAVRKRLLEALKDVKTT
jgi:hypothetical protein